MSYLSKEDISVLLSGAIPKMFNTYHSSGRDCGTEHCQRVCEQVARKFRTTSKSGEARSAQQSNQLVAAIICPLGQTGGN